MKHLLHTLPVLLLILIVLAIHSGCRENTLINSKISPSNNAVNDSGFFLPCITHTYYDDTTLTSIQIGGVPVFEGVGTYTDPFFGTMAGTTYFNLIPGAFDPIVTSLVDSVVLVLPYAGFTYGDTITTTLTQTYQVFYLTEPLNINTNYYSYSTKPIDANNPLSDPATVNIKSIQDSFDMNTGIPNNYPGLRIKLKLNPILSLLNNAVNSLTTSTNPYQQFQNTFNGICVRPANTEQFNTAMPYFQMDGADQYSQAGLLVYYHPTGGNPAGVDTDMILNYYFSTGYCAHFNNITKSYSRFPVSSLLKSTQPNDQIIALQNSPGANLDIVIPGITKLPSGIINKAELQLALLPGYGNKQGTPNGDSILLAPEKLYPVGIGNGMYPTGITNGLTYILADRYPVYSNTPYTVLDGTLHQVTRGATALNTFTIDIPREVMASIAAKNDTIHLHIEGTEDFYGAFHMVAGGGAYPDTAYRPRLFIVYSKLTNN